MQHTPAFKKPLRAMTLSELVVIIVILGILVAIALFAYRSATNNAYDTSAKAAVQQIAHDATGSRTGTLQQTNFEEALPSFSSDRFDTPGEIAPASTRFGQFAIAYSQDGQTAGIAVRSKTGRCATGIAKINSAVLNLRISDNIPAVCTAYTDLVQAGYTPLPPTRSQTQNQYTTIYTEYATVAGPTIQPPEYDENDPTYPIAYEIYEQEATEAGIPPVPPGNTGQTGGGGQTIIAGMVMPQYGVGDFGVFSENTLNITNNFRVIPTNQTVSVWAGNNFTCNSSGRIQGNLLTAGNATLTNNCQIDGLLWTGGHTRSTTTTVALNNVITTDYNTTNPVTITGLLSAPVKTGPWTSSSNSTEHQTPPTQTLPKLHYLTDNTWNGVTWNNTTWANIITTTANNNTAPAWSGARTNPCADLSAANYSLKGHITLPAVPTIIDGRACDKNHPITFNGNPAPLQLRVAADTIIYAGSFIFDGNVTVTSADGAPHRLWIITPAQATGTCDPNEAKIEFKAGGQTWSDQITVSTYTGGTTTFTNNLTYTGSAYACQINASVNTTIHQQTQTWPGL